MVKDSEKINVLILTRDDSLKQNTKSTLESEGYSVNECSQEENLLEELKVKKAELLLMDEKGLNVNELCKRVKAKFNLRHIPILLLTEKSTTIEKLSECIEAGVEDYIEKPPPPQTLLTRVKASLWRVKRTYDTNPLTQLPGSTTTLKELEARIKRGDEFCVGYADLNRLKEYNLHYGFKWGDRIIKHIALLISRALEELGTEQDFLGHIGADNFIFITDFDGVESICKKIINDFNSSMNSFYKEEDIKRGYILSKNREGKLYQTPLLTLSIGVATNKNRQFIHVGHIIQIVTELKNYAKNFLKSIYIIDRRKD
jgi:PleD family two-component response regulator